MYGIFKIYGYNAEHVLLTNILKNKDIDNEIYLNKDHKKPLVRDYISNSNFKKINMPSITGMSGAPILACIILEDEIRCKLLGTLYGESKKEFERTKAIANEKAKTK